MAAGGGGLTSTLSGDTRGGPWAREGGRALSKLRWLLVGPELRAATCLDLNARAQGNTVCREPPVGFPWGGWGSGGAGSRTVSDAGLFWGCYF